MILLMVAVIEFWHARGVSVAIEGADSYIHVALLTFAPVSGYWDLATGRYVLKAVYIVGACLALRHVIVNDEKYLHVPDFVLGTVTAVVAYGALPLALLLLPMLAYVAPPSWFGR